MPTFSQALTFFCTRDLPRSERFYGGTLGLEVAMRTPTAVVWRITDTAYFGMTAGPGREPKAGAALLDLVVRSKQEVLDWHRRIEADGHKTDGAPRLMHDGMTGFFATDPDGYLVEIIHFADESVLGAR
jgi:catechol 2,3-dioxygenase-like lactoylglutathione lyase family enzyme